MCTMRKDLLEIDMASSMGTLLCIPGVSEVFGVGFIFLYFFKDKHRQNQKLQHKVTNMTTMQKWKFWRQNGSCVIVLHSETSYNCSQILNILNRRCKNFLWLVLLQQGDFVFLRWQEVKNLSSADQKAFCESGRYSVIVACFWGQISRYDINSDALVDFVNKAENGCTSIIWAKWPEIVCFFFNSEST